MKTWVWSLASLSGLRIWRCHELSCRSQMRPGSGVAVAVMQASGCSSNLTPSMGTSIGPGCGLKKKKKKNKKESVGDTLSKQSSLKLFEKLNCPEYLVLWECCLPWAEKTNYDFVYLPHIEDHKSGSVVLICQWVEFSGWTAIKGLFIRIVCDSSSREAIC